MAESKLLLSARARTTEPVLSDLEVSELSLNLDGRLRTAGKPALFVNGIGALTTAGSAAANVVAVDVTDCSNVVFGLKNTGTAAMAAGVFAFEASLNSTDGVDGDWVTVQAVRSDSNLVESARQASSLIAGGVQPYAWEASVNGYRWFRVRCTTSVTASSIATWTIGRGSYATEPIPAIQTHPVSGSGAFLMAPSGGTEYNLVTTASTNGASIVNGIVNLMEIAVSNLTAAVIYVKLYNKASAPTVGTDVPKLTIPVPIGAFVSYEFGQQGKRFQQGLAIAVTAGAPATDSASVAVGAQISLTRI